jgi:type VI secretion system protein ImpL
MGMWQQKLLEIVAKIPKEYLHFISIGLIIIAIVLVIIFLCVCAACMYTKPVTLIQKKNKDEPKKDPPPVVIKARPDDMPFISGRFGEILSLNGVLKAGPITKIFFKVVEILKNSTYDLKWRYKFPCFMIMGPKGSGKTTLLDSLNFEQLVHHETSVRSMWKLFKRGIICELPEASLPEESDNFLSFIAELFVFIRPQRPLDGIIVTLPADMLLADIINLEKHAHEVAEKVFAIQRDVNMRLPIYLIVTKTDAIPGFAEFANLFNEQSKQHIFGWSNPHAISSAFSSTWISEIFETLMAGILNGTISLSTWRQCSDDLAKAILFETQFQSISEPLARYVETMFRSNSPEEGFLLRGVYFIGQQKEVSISDNILQISALNLQKMENMRTIADATYNDRLYFVEDLFGEKIFKEYNIAHPLKQNSIDMNHIEFRNKAIFAGTAFGLSFGWFFGNFSIKSNIRDYYYQLYSIKTSLEKVKNLEAKAKSPEDREVINKNIAALLQSMPVVSRWRLTSIFVPQSWFSSLHADLKETIGVVFDGIVMRAMYIDLMLDTKSIFNYSGNPLSFSTKKDLFDINTFESFKKLKDFAEKVSTLKKMSSEYNSVRHLEDRKKVIDLTNAIFKDKFEITAEMKNSIPNRRVMPPPFDVTIFQPRIEQQMKKLFDDFLKDTCNELVEKILENITADLELLVKVSADPAADFYTSDLAKIYKKTVLMVDILKNKNFLWITREHFVPNKEYVDMINLLRNSEIISRGGIRDILQSAEREFSKFKEKLLTHKSQLTDQLLLDAANAPSEGFVNTQKELKILLDQPFICTVPQKDFSTIVLDDKMLIWDLKSLKSLSDLIDKYYEFITKTPKEIREQNYDMYKTIARKCFYHTAESMLGRAQVFEDLPLGQIKNLLENAYTRQCTNIKNVSALLGKIAKFTHEMYEEDSTRDFGLISLIVSHYTSLLEKIDALFKMETPYTSGESLFDSWSGEDSPKFLNMNNHEELKKYLMAQLQRIKFLAKDLASPVVDILSMPYIVDQMKNKNLLEKWREIIAGVDSYEAKQPGNSLASLEAFLSETLSKVSMDSFDEHGSLKDFSASNGDFFESKRSDVAKSLMSRAEVVKYDKAVAAYNKIYEFFNTTLSNKFPFGEALEEVLPSEVESFIKLYEKNSLDMLKTLEKNKDTKKVNAKAITFIQSLEHVISFLKIWIAHSKTMDPKSAAMSFTVFTRPYPNEESSTSAVLERLININDNAVENNGTAICYNGDKVIASFTWVEKAKEQPSAKGSTNKNFSVNKEIAKFTYGGKWGMFRLIENHRTEKEKELDNGVTLRFEVPITKNKELQKNPCRMLLKIMPMGIVKDKMEKITWPVFPVTCPRLHEDDEDIQVNAVGDKNNGAVNFDKELEPADDKR